MLHGAGGDGPGFERYTGYSELADREGFVAVYPSAIDRFWTLGESGEPDDVRFLSELLDRDLPRPRSRGRLSSLTRRERSTVATGREAASPHQVRLGSRTLLSRVHALDAKGAEVGLHALAQLRRGLGGPPGSGLVAAGFVTSLRFSG